MPVPLTLKVFKGETLVTAKDFERDIPGKPELAEPQAGGTRPQG